MVFQVRAAAFASVVLGLLAGGAGASQASTLRLNMQNDMDSVDPAIDYLQAGWQAEYATCLKLLNYPDAAGDLGKELVPDAASALPAVSADGRTYTFTIRKGLRFSPPSGERVNAETFKHVFERDLTPALISPAQPFFVDIVGAQE